MAYKLFRPSETVLFISNVSISDPKVSRPARKSKSFQTYETTPPFPVELRDSLIPWP
jgi:hypothetical protein